MRINFNFRPNLKYILWFLLGIFAFSILSNAKAYYIYRDSTIDVDEDFIYNAFSKNENFNLINYPNIICSTSSYSYSYRCYAMNDSLKNNLFFRPVSGTNSSYTLSSLYPNVNNPYSYFYFEYRKNNVSISPDKIDVGYVEKYTNQSNINFLAPNTVSNIATNLFSNFSTVGVTSGTGYTNAVKEEIKENFSKTNVLDFSKFVIPDIEFTFYDKNGNLMPNRKFECNYTSETDMCILSYWYLQDVKTIQVFYRKLNASNFDTLILNHFYKLKYNIKTKSDKILYHAPDILVNAYSYFPSYYTQKKFNYNDNLLNSNLNYISSFKFNDSNLILDDFYAYLFMFQLNDDFYANEYGIIFPFNFEYEEISEEDFKIIQDDVKNDDTQQNFDKINGNLTDINDNLNNINNSLTDESLPDTGKYGEVAGWLPSGTIDSLINLPLTLFTTLNTSASQQCKPYNLPYIGNSTIEIPCVGNYLTNLDGWGGIISFIDMAMAVILLYKLLMSLYKDINKITSLKESDNDLGGVE